MSEQTKETFKSINYKTSQFRENYETMKYNETHGIVPKMSNVERNMNKILYSFTFAEEKIALDLHKLCPNLDETEIDTFAVAVFSMDMIENNTPKICLSTYLQRCTDYDQDTIKLLSGEKEKALEWLRGFILFFSEKDRNRGIEKH